MDDFRGRISQSIYMKNLPLNSKGGSQQNCFKIYNPASVSLLFPRWGRGRKVKYSQSVSGPHSAAQTLHIPCSGSHHSSLCLSWHFLCFSHPGLIIIHLMDLGSTLLWSEALGDAKLLSRMVFLSWKLQSGENNFQWQTGKEDGEVSPVSYPLDFHMCSLYFQDPRPPDCFSILPLVEFSSNSRKQAEFKWHLNT